MFLNKGGGVGKDGRVTGELKARFLFLLFLFAFFWDEYVFRLEGKTGNGREEGEIDLTESWSENFARFKSPSGDISTGQEEVRTAVLGMELSCVRGNHSFLYLRESLLVLSQD